MFSDVVYPMEMKASYTTPFRCLNGSYALIRGADLTLEYDYGYNYSKVRSVSIIGMGKIAH